MVNLKLTLIMRIFQRQIRMNDNIQFNLIPKSNFEKKYLDIHEGKKV